MWLRPSLVVPLILVRGAAFGADWPNLRGPDWDGRSAETGVTGHWAPGGPPVLWEQTIGQGYSGFAIASGRAFTMQQSALGQSMTCLDAETGESLWKYRCGLPYEPLGIYPGPRATPTASAGRVYFVTPRSVAGCLDATTGRKVWEVDLSVRFTGAGTGFGYAASPLVLDGRVILPVGGKGTALVALDAADGSTVWTSGDYSASYCPTIPITLDGRTLLVSYLENVLTIHDPLTGRLLADHDVSHGYDEHAALPLWEAPRLIFAAPFKAGATCVTLSWVDESTPGERIKLAHAWHNQQMSNDVCSSVIVGGHLYGFDLRDPQSKAHRPSRGQFRCLDVETGETLWSTDRVGQASLVVADAKLILFVDTGELILARASPIAYEELARTQVFSDEICWTSPALADGRLYLRTQSRAACLYLGENANSPQVMEAAAKARVLRSSRLKWIRCVLGGEREHPFMRPAVEDLWRWYAACLVGVFMPLALLTSLVALFKPQRAKSKPVVHFCLFVLVVGVVLTPVLNLCLGDRTETFWFTWPVSVWAAFQLAVIAAIHVQADATDRTRRRWSRCAGLLFIATSGAMFWALRQQSLPHEWVFLLGPLPAAVFAVVAARSTLRRGWAPATVFWLLLTMTVCFWSGPLWQHLRETLAPAA